MSEKTKTITGGLGIKEEYFDIAKDRVLKKLKEHWSKPAPSEKYPKWDHPDDNPGNSGSLVKK